MSDFTIALGGGGAVDGTARRHDDAANGGVAGVGHRRARWRNLGSYLDEPLHPASPPADIEADIQSDGSINDGAYNADEEDNGAGMSTDEESGVEAGGDGDWTDDDDDDEL